MRRLSDMMLGILLVVLFAVPMLLIAIAVVITSTGPILHWSPRVGYNNRLFLMPKFRSMRINTPQLATHLLGDPSAYLTPIGGFLRASSLDELPQLFSVLWGDLSLVGPRPALFNQYDLISLRTTCGVHKLKPGITGWAQVNGRDNLAVAEKVRLDCEYLRQRSLALELRILCMTLIQVTRREGVSH